MTADRPTTEPRRKCAECGLPMCLCSGDRCCDCYPVSERRAEAAQGAAPRAEGLNEEALGQAYQNLGYLPWEEHDDNAGTFAAEYTRLDRLSRE